MNGINNRDSKEKALAIKEEEPKAAEEAVAPSTHTSAARIRVIEATSPLQHTATAHGGGKKGPWHSQQQKGGPRLLKTVKGQSAAHIVSQGKVRSMHRQPRGDP